MDDEEFDALNERLSALRKEYRKNKSNVYPPGVRLLENMIEDDNLTDDNLIMLRSTLVGEYVVHGMIEKAELLLRCDTETSPNEPVAWISLASFLHYAKEELAEALRVVEVAVEKARQTGEWVRHAYCTRARIARAMEDYDLLEETLRFLIDYSPSPGSIDIHLEHDFLVTLPAGKIDDEIRVKYNTLKSSKAGPVRWPEPRGE